MNYYYKVIAPIRWDEVAVLGYGDVGFTPDLLAANPDLPTYELLPAGAIVICPYIPEVTQTVNLSQMPEWKQ